MLSRVHDLKVHPDFFSDVEADRKNSEFRLNDRDYQVGDLLRIREWFPEPENKPPGLVVVHGYTGREVYRRVTHILTHEMFNPVPEGWVVLSMVPYYMSNSEQAERQGSNITAAEIATTEQLSPRIPLEDALRETSRPDTPLVAAVVAGWYDTGPDSQAFYLSSSLDVGDAVLLLERAKLDIVERVAASEDQHPDKNK